MTGRPCQAGQCRAAQPTQGRAGTSCCNTLVLHLIHMQWNGFCRQGKEPDYISDHHLRAIAALWAWAAAWSC
jgi:hypothetical protein